MHVRALEISNFRAIASAKLENLRNNIVIAGPNGCGKSTVFHALRLWKSVQAGYVDNEPLQWLSEFEINLVESPRDLTLLFREPTKAVRIAGTVELANEEKDFIRANIDELTHELAWRDLGPRAGKGGRLIVPAAAAGLTRRREDTEQQAALWKTQILETIDEPQFEAELVIDTNLQMRVNPAPPVLRLVYAFNRPDAIGAFEYHTADRNYQREQVSNIDLRLESAVQQQGQTGLYNTAQKYQNIKSQMAGSYLRELIAKAANVEYPAGASLIESLRDLFRTFFPEKEFRGPVPLPTGKLSFNVTTLGGFEHDINDLSSGEKEVLYGYLRLRNLARRHSVLLFDEPELHLNPLLIRGLPQFYARQLGKPFDNQIWLLTHSDVLLREAIEQPDWSVFHMRSNPAADGTQVAETAKGNSLHRAILDLVGETAAYQPQRKLVIFEGGGDSQFDVTMTTTLFPSLAAETNPISGNDKMKVRELHRLLESASEAGKLNFKVFSITDRDSDDTDLSGITRAYKWNVYHIENYLVEPRFVLEVMQELFSSQCPFKTESDVNDALRAAARKASDAYIKERVKRWVDSKMFGCLQLGADSTPTRLVPSLLASIKASADRIREIVQHELGEAAVKSKQDEVLKEVEQSFSNDEWRMRIPGREILKRFAKEHGNGNGYPTLRNLTIARMRSADYQPAGMKKVIQEILDA